MEGNYQKLVELIAQYSGLDVGEIERRIEAKQAKLSGLISKEGAAQVIAAELNINFDRQIIKISHVVSGMRKINIIGKVLELFPIREYNKNGRSGRIASMILADDTSNIRTVLWDENHIELFADGKINKGDVVEINNASLRNGELHLGSFSDIKISENKIDIVVVDKPILKKTIYEFNVNENICTRAFIVQMYEPKFFEICTTCKKKVNEAKECPEHGKVFPEKRVLLSVVIDDGTESIRGTVFHEQLSKIMTPEELENNELFSKKKSDFVGKEVMITGNVKRNTLFNTNDFVINEIKDVDLDALIEELEK
ncbi:hypothetical protein J4456_04870 [Candidatus Pacearchaeota archaeon]|nr:hypothetical protein [Candidatus Pacearchaeota archaeon]